MQSNKTEKKKGDRVAARLTRGSQPRRRRVKGKRFSKEHQPKHPRGRPKGATNLMTRDVKEAIIAACNQIGSDGKGTGGLQGYMVFLGKQHPTTMGMLLRAIMPTQVTVERTERPKEYKTLEDAKKELEQYGIKWEPVHRLQYYKGPVIELDADDVADDADDGPSEDK